MINFAVSLITLATYGVISLAFARKAYRAEYDKVYGAPAPRSYGGTIGHDRAHQVARGEAIWWLAMWPWFCCWALMERMICGPVPVRAKLDMMQAEVDRLAEEQDGIAQVPIVVRTPPAPPCPCGYVTECFIHCGDGSRCHRGCYDRSRLPSNPEQGREMIIPRGAWEDPGL